MYTASRSRRKAKPTDLRSEDMSRKDDMDNRANQMNPNNDA